MAHIILPLIIWSPLEKHPGCISDLCPKCDDNSSKLHPTCWCDGQLGHEPRLLHCVHTNALLISRVYKCDKNHEVLGHHSTLIERLSNAGYASFIPFQLYHRTGFTTALIKFTTSMLNAGCNLLQLENILLSNRVASYFDAKQRFLALNFPDFDDISVSFWKDSPSRHSIGAILIFLFRLVSCSTKNIQ